jgi:GWxTD domain-containing protein
MKIKPVLVSLILLLAAQAAVADKINVKDLPPKYRQWLEEEVVYIISPKEKDVFLQLTNDRERELFIAAFWKARNPDPDSEENSAKKEHYRRIEYANKWFGRGYAAGGWRSDMGRTYIMLGEPKTIDKYENERDLYPMIVWFYEGMQDQGLPNAFNVVFFKKDGAGDYVLYSPVRDGPMKLMPNYNGDMTSYQHAYEEMLDISPALAEVSLTLIPGEYLLGMSPSISSDILIGQKIPKAAYEKVKDDYAQKLLRYKDIVEVEYTANYIASDAMVQVYRDNAGQAYVHYLIEPSRLSIQDFDGTFRTTLNVNGIVSNAQGRTVYQFDRSIPLELSSDQFAKIRNRLFCFQDMFPLIEGDYKLSLLWKNTASKEFTSVEAELKVPPAKGLTMTAPLLANRVVRNPAFVGQTKPFTIADTQLVASPRNDFAAQDTLSVGVQLGGVGEELRRTGSLVFTITKEDAPFQSSAKPLKDYRDLSRVVEDFPLASFAPAYYAVQVSVVDANKTELVTAKSRFYVSLSASVPRAWIMYAPLPPQGDPYFAHALGLQYLNAQNFERARTLLADAARRSPGSPEFTADLCRALLAAKDYEGVKAAALPFYRDQKNIEFAQYLGESAQAMGQYGEAIAYYKDYLAALGTNINVLNSIGECYVKTGDPGQALTAWKKSLELSPGQETLKKKVAELEGKIKE